MTLFMETTRINSQRTVGEIQQILSKHGATQILMEFSGMEVEAVSFMFPNDDKTIPFRLPCRWKELETVLRESGKRPKSGDTYTSWARRVAWRQILRWVEAQMALVETKMVDVKEVFLPYVYSTKTGRTIYEQLEQNNFTMLEYKGNGE